jgi:phage terminase Nu1 subunit (DNA packaging protein)
MAKRERFHGNHRETAQLLGISEQALWKAVKERECPVLERRGSGKETLYDWREILVWRVADLMPDDLDLNRERARLAKEQADKTAMANALMRGELHSRARMVEEVSEYIDACRKRLINLPSTLAQQFDPDTARRVELIARERIYEAVAELREVGGGRVAGAVDAAADPDRERVVGPVPKAPGRKRRGAGAVADG